MYNILLHKKAAKVYENLDDKISLRINKAMNVLKANPFYGKDIKRLRGKLEGKYRLRMGEYRIVYRIEEKENIIVIDDINSRERSY